MGLIDNRDAQFMLLAGFLIAIGLVITTVMLNSIIFQGNMAGEAGSDPSKYEIVNLMQITADDTKSAYRDATNVSGVTKVNMIANFTNQTQNFSAYLPKIYAQRGESVNVSWDISNWNNDIHANFTNNGTANGATNWTVMESVKTVSMFELRNVSGTSGFMVNITNQTTGAFLWSMTLSGTSVTISNWSGGSPVIYGVDSSYINLLNSSYNLVSIIGSNTTKITFLNGANAGGGFTILGYTSYNTNFTRARDYILNDTVALSTSSVSTNITIPVSVPW